MKKFIVIILMILALPLFLVMVVVRFAWEMTRWFGEWLSS